MALAGMRVGYMIATPETAQKISAYGMGGYGLNQAGIAAAVASYNDTAFLAYSKSKIIEAREMILGSREGQWLECSTLTNKLYVRQSGRY